MGYCTVFYIILQFFIIIFICFYFICNQSHKYGGRSRTNMFYFLKIEFCFKIAFYFQNRIFFSNRNFFSKTHFFQTEIFISNRDFAIRSPLVLLILFLFTNMIVFSCENPFLHKMSLHRFRAGCVSSSFLFCAGCISSSLFFLERALCSVQHSS